MANRILSYLKLTWLCFKLSLNLLFFALTVLLLKMGQKKTWPIIIITLILLIWIANVYILIQKNTPKLEVSWTQKLENLPQTITTKEEVLLTKEQAEDQIRVYEKMEINNLSLWLNLSQLSKILGNDDLAQEYLDKAKAIAPQIKYSEN